MSKLIVSSLPQTDFTFDQPRGAGNVGVAIASLSCKLFGISSRPYKTFCGQRVPRGITFHYKPVIQLKLSVK